MFSSILAYSDGLGLQSDLAGLELREKAIIQAEKALDNATKKAEKDVFRPLYHFTAPANWMNDINGPLYYNGYYHIFYQHNPYNDYWNHMHWGHAKSRDLIHWEHLPIALWPSFDKGELHCFSGCSVIGADGLPIIFYTKVTYPEPQDESPYLWPLIAHEQWAAIPEDGDLVLWKKHPLNPILTLENHGGPDFEPNWRDPFIFQEAGRTFMILGGDIDDRATIPIYEAKDKSLLKWEYKGIFYEEPRENTFFFECPNFFKLGNKWYLIYSAHKPVTYYVGEFDLNSYKFKPQERGLIDYSTNFYASNLMHENNRILLYGWIKDFKEDMGWSGAMSIPRQITRDSNGGLLTYPVEEARALRKTLLGTYKFRAENKDYILDQAVGRNLEIEATFKNINSANFGLTVFRDSENRTGLTISIHNNVMTVGDVNVPLQNERASNEITLNIFLDNSIAEVFLNKGEAVVTKVFYPTQNGVGISVFSDSGSVEVDSINVWQLGL